MLNGSRVYFDTQKAVDGLIASGLKGEMARAIVDTINVAVSETVATKEDLSSLKSELKGDISALRAELKKDISDLRTEAIEREMRMVKWMIALNLATAAFIISAIKLL